MNAKLGRNLFARIAAILASRRQPDFTCGDCDRFDRCGLPPSETCVVRAEQLERGDWKLRRKARALARSVGPM